MTIVIITTSWYGGGAEAVARDSYKFFVECGNNCYYACSRTKAPAEVRIVPIGHTWNVYMHALKSRLLDRNGFGSKMATKQFVEKLKIINPDVIIIHNIVCYTLNIGVLFDYLRTSNKRVIWTLHDCWSFTGHCYSYMDVNCYKWKNQCGNCPAQHEYPNSYFIDQSKRNLLQKKRIFSGIPNMAIVVPSKWLAGIVKETYLNQYRIYTIHNGIDLNEFKPIESDIKSNYGIAENKKVILGVSARWTARKGISYIIEMDKMLDHDKYQIVLIGMNKKDARKLPYTIIGIEKTNSKVELAKWYSAADVFINPSIADNFPTVNIEALACGTPAVVFDTGGSWESIGDSCGALVKNKCASGLYDGVMKCLAKKISKRTCINAAKEFEKTKCYKNYIDIIKNDYHEF